MQIGSDEIVEGVDELLIRFLIRLREELREYLGILIDSVNNTI